MTQKNLPMKQKQTDIENRPVVAKGRGEQEGRIGNVGLAEANYYTQD